ncbi:MAG: hypothetical protein D6B26_07205, partial [Spirochaetaceae bacterium]
MKDESLTLLRIIADMEPRAPSFLASIGATVIARRISTGSMKAMPVKTLLHNDPGFYLSTSDFEFYVDETAIERLIEQFPSLLAVKTPNPSTAAIVGAPSLDPAQPTPAGKADATPASTPAPDMPPNFGPEYSEIRELSASELLELVSGHVQLMESLGKKSTPEKVAEVLNEASAS